MPLQIRRGPTADREANVPLAGELVYDTTTGSVYVGNGTTAGGLPVTNFSVDNARTTTAKMFLGESLNDNSVHSGVTFAKVGDRLQATVAQDLSNYIGLIASDRGFKGNVWADDSGVGFLGGKPLVNSETGEIYGNFLAASSIIPDTNIAYDLGSSSYRFRDLYLSGSSIYLGDAVITSTGTAVNFPVGSTIGGQPVGINEGDTYDITISGNVIGTDSTVLVNTTNGTFNGDLYGSVFGWDSTILVDARDGVLRGTLIGTLTGNVTGDLTGIASSATVATNVSLVDSSSSIATHYLTFSLGTSGTRVISADTSLTYQPSSNTLATGVLNSTTINATTVNATTVSATSVTGTTVFAGTIDNIGDSSGLTPSVTFVPAVVFNSDVTIENELLTGGHIFPVTSESYDLGSYTKKFGKLYLTEGDNALWIGNATISGNGTVINLPAGSTVGGSAITTAAGSNATTITVNTTGTNADYFVSFFDDQTGDNLIYTDDTFKYNPGTGRLTVGDATIGSVTGNLLGNVTGSLFGNADTATTASTVALTATNTTAAAHFVTFVDTATGNENLRTDTDLTYNPSTNTLTTNISSTGTSAFVNITATGATTLATGSFNTSDGVTATSVFGVTQAHSTVDARNVTFARGRGTTTAPTIVSNGDDIADIVFAGRGTSAYTSGAQISVIVEDAAPSNTSMKSRMVFSTNTGAGLVDHVTLDSNGVLTVNTFSSGSIQIVENTITTLDSNDDIVFDPSGTGTVELIVPEQTSVGAAGFASALPATPAKYFKIKLNGVEYVVPAYAVS